MPISQENCQAALRALQQYPAVPYADVQAPVSAALAEANVDVERDRAVVSQSKRQLEAERGDKQRELEEWQHLREPEPPRSEARALARRRRMEAAGAAVGGPLYTLCEFQPHVDEGTQAALETALFEAGVLDAWVSPSGGAVDEDDVWLPPLYKIPTIGDNLSVHSMSTIDPCRQP
ncbi:MAG: hypothetical protein K6T78_15055, partial [Alicyclobacillus sp.]|nr:hypothetical protein [Alicyclobacillus sp.]